MAIEVAPAVEVRKKLTPDDVLKMSNSGELDGQSCELVDGELVEMPPAFGIHGITASSVFGPLWNFSQKAGGWALGAGAGFLVGKDYANVREPDVAYIGPARNLEPGESFIKGAPDLAVEVLSEGQYGEAYAKGKVREYFEAGAKLVWLLDYRRKEVRVYTPNSDTYTIMRGEAMLTLEPIIAGFSLKVADIFR